MTGAAEELRLAADAIRDEDYPPEVGKALAAELRRMAGVLEGTCDCHWPAEPFNLARLILGGSDV